MQHSQSSPETVTPPPPPLSEIAHRFRGYCVACGQRTITIQDGRCVSCLDAPLRYCLACGSDIAPETDLEVVRRIRHASWDVNDAWIEGKHFDAHRARERVAQARAASGVRP